MFKELIFADDYYTNQYTSECCDLQDLLDEIEEHDLTLTEVFGTNDLNKIKELIKIN